MYWTVVAGLSLLALLPLNQAKEKVILQLPSYIGKGCVRDDPNIDDCMVKKGAPIIKGVSQGDPKYRLPRFEPFELKEVKINEGTKTIGLSLTLTDCKAHGLSETKFIKSESDWKKRQINWWVTLEKLFIEGNYNISGNVLLLPILGQGDMTMNLTDIEAHFTFNWTTTERDGHEFIKLVQSDVPFSLGGATLHFNNLFNGDKALGETTNKFINENWREILKELNPALRRTFGAIANKIVQNVANLVPYDVFFPKS